MGARTMGIDQAAAPRPQDAKSEGARTGTHALVVSAPGYVTFKWEKALGDTEAAVVDVTLAPLAFATGGRPTGTPKWLFFTAAGGAVAALGTATALGIYANGQQNDQLALPGAQRSASTKSAIQTESTVANALFIGGGVLGIGATVLAFTTHWKAEKGAGEGGASVRMAPWATPFGAGLGANGSF